MSLVVLLCLLLGLATNAQAGKKADLVSIAAGDGALVELAPASSGACTFQLTFFDLVHHAAEFTDRPVQESHTVAMPSFVSKR
jgi:hypothetical protein